MYLEIWQNFIKKVPLDLPRLNRATGETTILRWKPDQNYRNQHKKEKKRDQSENITLLSERELQGMIKQYGLVWLSTGQ